MISSIVVGHILLQKFKRKVIYFVAPSILIILMNLATALYHVQHGTTDVIKHSMRIFMPLSIHICIEKQYLAFLRYFLWDCQSIIACLLLLYCYCVDISLDLKFESIEEEKISGWKHACLDLSIGYSWFCLLHSF